MCIYMNKEHVMWGVVDRMELEKQLYKDSLPNFFYKLKMKRDRELRTKARMIESSVG